MTGSSLPRSTPAAQNVDANGIAALLDALEDAPQTDPHGLMVLRHGCVVAEGWWAPYTADRVHLLYSLSKSFTSTALGFAVAEGLVDLDAPVVSYFPAFGDDITDPRCRSILVRHVAAMSSGHLTDTWSDAVQADRAEPVRGFLLLPPEQEPGSVFAYNQSCTYSLAAIIQRQTGQTLVDYLRPRLFEPLGIGEARWQEWPDGRNLGFSGLHATTDAVARLGQLYLQRGAWAGQQLLSQEWVAEATRPRISTGRDDSPDWNQGYGYQFWGARHGYRGDGAYGQFCLVLPEQDTVVAITSATTDMASVLDAVWTHLLPALSDGASPDPGADETLHRRLAGLALPTVPAVAAPDVDEVSFTPAAGRNVDQPSLVGVTVTRVGDSWAVTLDDAGSLLPVPLSSGGWCVTERDGGCPPVAATGGWTGQGTLRLEVVFLETPHRLTVTGDLSSRTFTARWATEPLSGGPLSRLQAP